MKTIFIYGPTASGKSGIALDIAEKFSGIIVNCDSRQIYVDLGVGAAKPTPADLARVPHALYDVARAPDVWTVGDYHRAFFEWYRAHVASTRLAIVTGGTGFYFQALKKGLWKIPKVDPQIQAAFESQLKLTGGESVLYDRLRMLDPDAASKISPQDHYRLIRFLEIISATGKSVSEWRAEHDSAPDTYPSEILEIYVSPEKEELQRRIEHRAREMFRGGFVAEVEALLARRGLATWKALESVGYREIKRGLAAGASEAEMITDVALGTRQLAKKQRTWFSREKHAHVFSKTADLESVVIPFLSKG